ncbi:MAG: hypothetical protein PHY45_08395 [Rhodocyclaceae bacterium]|nr:hypothetical protein [Rhodocyclaceae bacterium]
MLIKASTLSLTSTHELQTSSLTQVRIAGTPLTDGAFGRILEGELHAPPAALLRIDSPAAAAAPEAKDPFQAVMELLFGITPMPGDLSPLDGGASASHEFSLGDARGMRLIQTGESESCTFAASGSICLADGSQRQFDVSYALQRSEQSTEVSDEAALKDPLVVDLAAPSAAPATQNVAFDLDGDGKTENVRLPTGSSAVLFDDRNHNGKADDGSELFGPQSGNGFADLAKLDSDGNGWIDSGDAAYADLKLWQVAADGKGSVESLADAGIGALATASTATPFTLKEDGATVGQVRASSVWLGENGGAGTVRQIDVGVTKAATSSA